MESPDQKNGQHYTTALKNDDADTWRHLIRIYYPVLCRFAEKTLKDAAAAEDLTTEVFIRVWQKKTEFTNLIHLKSYLYASIRNGCLNLIRSKQREEIRNLTFADLHLKQEQSSDNELIYLELLTSIREELDNFTPRMREIFLLAYFKRLSNEEIAVKLNLSNQTVRNQKALGLSQLRKKLKTKYPLRHISMLLA